MHRGRRGPICHRLALFDTDFECARGEQRRNEERSVFRIQFKTDGQERTGNGGQRAEGRQVAREKAETSLRTPNFRYRWGEGQPEG